MLLFGTPAEEFSISSERDSFFRRTPEAFYNNSRTNPILRCSQVSDSKGLERIYKNSNKTEGCYT